MNVAVFGAGYVGLVTGVAFAYLGTPVTLVDINPERVYAIQAGETPIFEPHLAPLLQSLVKDEMLRATSHAKDAVPSSDVIIIAVNTPPLPSGEADMQYVRNAAMDIGRHLRIDPPQVIVTKSTVPIGSANLVKLWVEDGFQEIHGHRPDSEVFAVASNPEFLREGQAVHDTLYPDRIIFGADTPWAETMLRDLYRPLIDQSFVPPQDLPRPIDLGKVPVAATDRISSEMIKYAANAFLATKISFANEMAGICERIGADVTAVMEGIGLDRRIGREFLHAGVGWGGSCFGKDLAALVHTAREYGLEPQLVEATISVNQQQRRLLVNKLQASLKTLKGRRIAVLGLAFKPGTDDLRDAPALSIIDHLLRMNARVVAYDPVAMPNAKILRPEWAIEYAPSALDALLGAEASLIITDWAEFRSMDWRQAREVMAQPVIVDGRNVLDPRTLKDMGFIYDSIGR